ncbi:MAG: HAD-IA family hydrolase [Candidatus Brocadiaceae bacterium]|jgi:phosphoglycolate phosphatase
MTREAVLFDLDGTLLDTLEDIVEATNTVLAGMDLPTHPADRFRHFVGDGLRNQVLRALPERHRDEETVARCMRSIREEYATRWANHTRPYAGVPELLDALAGRGVRTAVLSNKPDGFTKEMVEQLLPDHHFEVVVGARPGVRLKPDPVAALEVAERMSLDPGSYVYLGDTDTDMKTARAAGMHAVGALWGFRDALELRAGGAQELIERPLELLAFL